MSIRLAEQEKEKKAQIILLERFSNSFFMLTDAQAGRMVKAIFQYKISKQEPNFQGDGILVFFWQDIKNWLDDSENHYKRVCEINRANINARWKNKNDVSENTSVYERTQTNTEHTNAMANAMAYGFPKKETVIIDSTNKGNGNFETAVKTYQEKIGNLKPPQEVEHLQDLLNKYSFNEVLTAINIMASTGGRSVKALENILETSVDF